MDNDHHLSAKPEPVEAIAAERFSTPPPPATPKARELLARHYSDRFWSSLSSTSTVLVGWLVALLIIWIGYIFPLAQKAERFDTLVDKTSKKEKELEHWDKKSEASARMQKVQERVNERKRKEQDLQEALAKIETPLGTLEIGERQVPARSGPFCSLASSPSTSSDASSCWQ